jgi:hypothetical protein
VLKKDRRPAPSAIKRTEDYTKKSKEVLVNMDPKYMRY